MAATTSARTLPPAAPGLPVKVASLPPNQTLYVRNVPSSKIQKEDLRMALYMLFSTYGPVLDVVVLKTAKMRGQAHIVYRDIQTSTQALRALDGYRFLGHELKITYAKGKSQIVAKLDGTFRIGAAAAVVETTALQQSIFNAPARGSAASAVPPKPAPAVDAAKKDGGATEGRGQKRGRDDEEEEEDSDVAMEEDSDDE